jgi:hypothetical protein
MFPLVNRSFIRTLIYVLVAGQVLLSAPVASAPISSDKGGAAGAAAAEMPCADSMPQGDESKPCPCCPDGTSGVAGCLSACAGAAAAPSVPAIQTIAIAAQPAPRLSVPQITDLSEPPLKPPPIA